jgi:crotonobetainyl-CoA:carnitine CoA-transferase CaiB-like acyl-CoA transferase
MTPGAADGGGPLSHVRVLDFTALVQGPMATQVLGDLGADVIKVERPAGEWMRTWGIANGHSHGETDAFLAFNRNKRSVAADLKDPDLRARLLRLGGDADVVVENFRPGVLARLATDTTDHWLDRLLEHDVWAGPVQTYDDLVTDPQVAHNEVFWDVPVGTGADSFRTPGSPFRFSLTPPSLRRGVPRCGQHTAEILGGGNAPDP